MVSFKHISHSLGKTKYTKSESIEEMLISLVSGKCSTSTSVPCLDTPCQFSASDKLKKIAKHYTQLNFMINTNRFIERETLEALITGIMHWVTAIFHLLDSPKNTS